MLNAPQNGLAVSLRSKPVHPALAPERLHCLPPHTTSTLLANITLFRNDQETREGAAREHRVAHHDDDGTLLAAGPPLPDTPKARGIAGPAPQGSACCATYGVCTAGTAVPAVQTTDLHSKHCSALPIVQQNCLHNIHCNVYCAPPPFAQQTRKCLCLS